MHNQFFKIENQIYIKDILKVLDISNSFFLEINKNLDTLILNTKVMNKKCYIGICTVFVKREYFLPFRNILMHEDYCLWLEILSTVPAIKTTTSPSCIHYRDPGSRSSSLVKNIKSVYSVYKILKNNFVFFRTIRYVYLGILERLRIKVLLIGLKK